MKDREVYEQLGGKMDEHQPSAECPVASIQDRMIPDDEIEDHDREVDYSIGHGIGQVRSFYPGEHDEHFSSLMACAVLGISGSIKKKYGGK